MAQRVCRWADLVWACLVGMGMSHPRGGGGRMGAEPSKSHRLQEG